MMILAKAKRSFAMLKEKAGADPDVEFSVVLGSLKNSRIVFIP